MIHLPLLCFCAFLMAALGDHDQGFRNGFYDDRSADIVLAADTFPIEIQLPWQLTHKDGQESLKGVWDFHVHNIVARALGLPQVRLPSHLGLETEFSDTIPFDFFSPKSGNMLFSVEGISRDQFLLSSHAMGATPIYALKQSSLPYHPLTTLTTLVTGVLPRKHGVVNERSVVSSVPNIFDVSKGLYSSRSEIVSGALSKPFAAVLSSHLGSNSHYWDSDMASFVPTSSTKENIVVNKATIPKYISALEFSSKIVFKENTVEVGEVVYDMNDKVDISLFAEVAFVYAWSSLFSQRTSPQFFFSYHFSSLTDIQAKYGIKSAQWITAVELIDSVLAHAISSNSSFEIIYLPHYSTPNTVAQSALVSPIVSGHVSEYAFPQIFLSEEGKPKQEELCAAIKEVLANDFSKTKVFCPNHQEKRNFDEDPQVAPTPLVSSPATILAFHYVFWTMMVLLAVLIWATIAIAYIEPDESIETAVNFKKGRAQ